MSEGFILLLGLMGLLAFSGGLIYLVETYGPKVADLLEKSNNAT